MFITSMSRDLIEWFSFAARQILEGKVVLTRQTTKLLSKYRKQLKKLAHPNVDRVTKRRIILSSGGGGYLGGVLIRVLLRNQRVIDDRFVTIRKNEEKTINSKIWTISGWTESVATQMSHKTNQ